MPWWARLKNAYFSASPIRKWKQRFSPFFESILLRLSRLIKKKILYIKYLTQIQKSSYKISTILNVLFCPWWESNSFLQSKVLTTIPIRCQWLKKDSVTRLSIAMLVGLTLFLAHIQTDYRAVKRNVSFSQNIFDWKGKKWPVCVVYY